MALMKGHPGTSGVLWWALGTDASASHLGQEKLGHEVHRQRILPEHMSFVDDLGRPSSAMTAHLEIRGAFRAARFKDIREFGLFGGAATEELESGTLINRAVHDFLDLGPDDLIERRLTLSFKPDINPTPEEFGPIGADLPVRAISGIDEFYASALGHMDIERVGQLAELDEGPTSIPPAIFRKIVEQARMVRRFRPPHISGPKELTVLGVLDSTPAELATRLGDGVTEDAAREIQRAFAPLQVALDNDVLGKISVGDTIGE